MRTKRSYSTVDVLQLQDRIQKAITQADVSGVEKAYVTTTNLYAVEDALVPFRQLGYTVAVAVQDGVLGENLVRLPHAEITIKLGSLK